VKVTAILLGFMLSTAALALEYAWDDSGAEAIEVGQEYLLWAELHELNGTPFIGYRLIPFEEHSSCKYASSEGDGYEATELLFDGVAHKTHVLCLKYEETGDFYYSLVTFNIDIQQQFISRFATEIGYVELEFDGSVFDIPTKGFNKAYSEKFN
jgi:hypothetical protein